MPSGRFSIEPPFSKPTRESSRQKVSAAEAAVLARGREIFYGPATVDEKEALEDALYALRAFRNSLDHAEAA